MYLWLVLSTFLAILAGYSVPMRSDTDKLTDVPVASANMIKMVIKHRGALNYGKQNKWPFYCAEAQTDATGKKSCADDKQIGFDNGVISDEDIEPYVPREFVIDDEYISEIYCYDYDAATEELSDDVTPCSDTAGVKKKRFVVTFGDLHPKWLSSSDLVAGGGSDEAEVMPNNDVMLSFRKYFGFNEYAGYVKEKASGTYIINYQGVEIYKIPNNMYANWKSSGNCNSSFNGSCIAYVSML